MLNHLVLAAEFLGSHDSPYHGSLLQVCAEGESFHLAIGRSTRADMILSTHLVLLIYLVSLSHCYLEVKEGIRYENDHKCEYVKTTNDLNCHCSRFG